MFQKRRFRNYLEYVQAYDPADSKTHQGMDLESKTTNADLFKYFKCDDNTQAFTGHAMGLYQDDGYLTQPVQQHRALTLSMELTVPLLGPSLTPLTGCRVCGPREAVRVLRVSVR